MADDAFTYHVGFVDRNQAARLVHYFNCVLKWKYDAYKHRILGEITLDNPGNYPEVIMTRMVKVKDSTVNKSRKGNPNG